MTRFDKIALFGAFKAGSKVENFFISVWEYPDFHVLFFYKFIHSSRMM